MVFDNQIKFPKRGGAAIVTVFWAGVMAGLFAGGGSKGAGHAATAPRHGECSGIGLPHTPALVRTYADWMRGRSAQDSVKKQGPCGLCGLCGPQNGHLTSPAPANTPARGGAEFWSLMYFQVRTVRTVRIAIKLRAIPVRTCGKLVRTSPHSQGNMGFRSRDWCIPKCKGPLTRPPHVRCRVKPPACRA